MCCFLLIHSLILRSFAGFQGGVVGEGEAILVGPVVLEELEESRLVSGDFCEFDAVHVLVVYLQDSDADFHVVGDLRIEFVLAFLFEFDLVLVLVHAGLDLLFAQVVDEGLLD